MIKKRTLKTAALLIVTVLVIGMSGCTKAKFSIDDCIEYINQKYDDKFSYLEFEDGLPQGGSTMEVYVESEKFPDSPVLVVEEIINDRPQFHDNYVAVKYKQQTYELLKEISEQVYGECRVIYEYYNGLIPDEFDNSTTFEEYISAKASDIYVNVLIPDNHTDENKEKELEEVYIKLCENKFNCVYEVYYVNNMDIYASVQSQVDIPFSDDWYKANGSFFMNEQFEISMSNWR